MFLNHFVKRIPDFRSFVFHKSFCTLNRCGQSLLFQLLKNKRFEEFKRHGFGKTALMQAKLRTNDDNRTTRIIDTLSKKILTEASLLSFEHVRKRTKRTMIWSNKRTRTSTIIKQSIDSFLKHSLFISHNDIRS